VPWGLSFLLCLSISPPFPWHQFSKHSILPNFPLYTKHNSTLLLRSTPPLRFRDVTTCYMQSFRTFSSIALASTGPKPSTQPQHSSTSGSSNLTGYTTVPKDLSPLVPTPTHSPNYMFPAFSLDCMIIEEGTDYSETSVSKYQQNRATSRKSEGLNISGIYKL